MRSRSLVLLVALVGCTPPPPAGGSTTAASTATASGASAAPVAQAEAGPSTLYLGTRQSCAVVGRLFYCWGYSASGQLLLPESATGACKSAYGIAQNGCVPTPTHVPALVGTRALAFGDEHACAVDASGGVSCWGDVGTMADPENGLSDCGTSRRCRRAPKPIAGVAEVEEIVAGIGTTCVRTKKQEAWCWGWNDVGQIGDGTTTGAVCNTMQHCRPTPTRVAGLSNVAQISLGVRHACALLGDGTVRCWGEGDAGQLGDGTLGATCGDTSCRPSPVAVKGLDHARQIAVGAIHSCALREGGTVVCWGTDDRLGRGTTEGGTPCGYKKHSSCRLTPERVAGVDGAVELMSGAESTCARTSAGKVLCWGRRPGSNVDEPNAPSAEPVAGISDATRLFMGDYHACALTRGGSVWCWGFNNFGQIGDGTVENRAAPQELKLPAASK